MPLLEKWQWIQSYNEQSHPSFLIMKTDTKSVGTENVDAPYLSSYAEYKMLQERITKLSLSECIFPHRNQ